MRPTNEKKDTTIMVEGIGRCRPEFGRCWIVTELETKLDLSGHGATQEAAIAALRRNYALGGFGEQATKKGARNAR